jgi:[ribosomal protein S5]-alanine N-acetyltransferase
VEIALVLRPEFWGWGRAVYEHITALAFGELQLPYLLVALPPTRARALGLLRLGFRRVEDTEIDGHPVTVYRLDAPSASTAT